MAGTQRPQKVDHFEVTAEELEARANALGQQKAVVARSDAEVVRAIGGLVRTLGKANREAAASTRAILLISVVSAALALGSLWMVYQQLIDTRTSIAIQDDIQLSSLLFNVPANVAIIGALDQGKPILLEHGGQNTGAQLDSYLGVFEEVDGAYGDSQISKDILCSSYGYYVGETWESPEVHDYILAQRKIDPSFFGGLEDLYTTMHNSHDGSCLLSKARLAQKQR